MALVTPDLSGTKDNVTPGSYKVMVKGSTVGEWPSGGKYVEWELETFGEAESKNNGRIIRHKTNLGTKDDSAKKLMQFYFVATGGQALQGSFDTDQLTGKRLAVEIDYQVKNGVKTDYTEVKRVKPIDM